MGSLGNRHHRGQALVGATLAVVCAVAPVTRAAEEDAARESTVHIARLHYEGGGDWYSNPSSMPNWMRCTAIRSPT
jgi:hypothetical protein